MVTSTEEGQQTIQGLLPDGTLVPINMAMQENKTPEVLNVKIKEEDVQMVSVCVYRKIIILFCFSVFRLKKLINRIY